MDAQCILKITSGWCNIWIKSRTLSLTVTLNLLLWVVESMIVHVSQRMTFLYSPRRGNWSSRPVTKPTAMISKAWRPCEMSNLDRTIAPLQMWVDTVSYPRACVVRPSKMTLYKEAYWPLAVSQSWSVELVSPDS